MAIGVPFTEAVYEISRSIENVCGVHHWQAFRVEPFDKFRFNDSKFKFERIHTMNVNWRTLTIRINSFIYLMVDQQSPDHFQSSRYSAPFCEFTSRWTQNINNIIMPGRYFIFYLQQTKFMGIEKHDSEFQRSVHRMTELNFLETTW